MTDQMSRQIPTSKILTLVTLSVHKPFEHLGICDMRTDNIRLYTLFI